MKKLHYYSFPDDNFVGTYVKAEDYEHLEDQLESEKKQKDFYISTIREHARAADIFQCGGKYAKEAELPIGDSCVVEGIKWMDSEIELLKIANQGWQNKWECAVEMAAKAENERDEALKLRNLWHKKWQEVTGDLMVHIEGIKNYLDNVGYRANTTREPSPPCSSSSESPTKH
jgi:hypothetical protein